MALLEINNLSIAIASKRELLPVVQDISFTIEEGQTLGIVGESGCGKSLTALAIMGLLQGTQVRITEGSINIDGNELLTLSAKSRRGYIGNEMAMIFQEPMTSLNPVYRVGDQIIEALRQHRKITKASARHRVLELLEMVKIPDVSNRIDCFPHQLSGGQRQRVMIAMALACEPRLLIADEPTTALDVTVQKEVLELMLDLQQRTGTAIMLISHDLGVIAETCDQVAVMYRGRIVESAPTVKLFSNIGHPYTQGLLDSIPTVETDSEWLKAIPGRVPTLDEPLVGCAFHPRCGHAQDDCRNSTPASSLLEQDHAVQCHFTGSLDL